MNRMKWIQVLIGFIFLVIITVGLFVKVIPATYFVPLVVAELGYYGKMTYDVQKKKRAECGH